MRVVYLSRDQSDAPPAPFRSGDAGTVWVGPDGSVESEVRVRLSANTTHALLGHGVVEALNRLPIEGSLGDGLQALFPPGVLDAARRIFYEADRRTYGARWEFVAHACDRPEPVEYRVRIDNREYQTSLSRLQYLTGVAGREGLGVWMRIAAARDPA